MRTQQKFSIYLLLVLIIFTKNYEEITSGEMSYYIKFGTGFAARIAIKIDKTLSRVTAFWSRVNFKK